MRNYYKPGSWNALCAVCGVKFKSFELFERWDGVRVCRNDWEKHHPSDLLRVTAHDTSPTWVRPDEEFVFVNVCTVETIRGIAGIGVSGCAIAGRVP